MTQEVADAQARAGEGVESFRAHLNDNQLRAVDQRYLEGNWMTLSAAIQALSDAQGILKSLAASAHPPAKWSLLVPIKLMKALHLQIYRVPGLQGRLGEAATLEEQTRVEKAKQLQIQQQAREVYEGVLDGSIPSIEEFERKVHATGNGPAVKEAFNTLKTGAPSTWDGNKRLPTNDVPPPPKTLPTEKGFRLLVMVKGGVDEVNGVARVTVQRPLDGDPTFQDCWEMLTFKCSPTDHKKLQLAQLAKVPVEVLLKGEVTLGNQRGLRKFDLTLVKLTSSHSTGELIRMAFSKEAELFEEANPT